MDILNFIITFFLGLSIIILYILFLPKSDYAWGGIQNKNIQRLYVISILMSGISYLVVWVRQVFYKNEQLLYTVGNLIFLFGSFLWPLILYFAPTKFHTVILTLSIASLGALLILIQQCIDQDIVDIIFGLYLFFHVFIMDNIIWSSSYRSLFAINDSNGWI